MFSLGASLISNPAVAWPLINTLQLIRFIPLTENSLTKATRKILTTAGEYSPLPKLSFKVFHEDSATKPYKPALNDNIQVSVFCLNASDSILIFFCLVIFIIIVNLTKNFPNEVIRKKCLKYLSKNTYSQFYRFFIQSYLDLIIFALLQLKSVTLI